jgi:ketosteroid isomerase-like protein
LTRVQLPEFHGTMKMKTLLVSFAFSFAVTIVCQASEEQALRDLDAQWSADAGVKDLEKVVSYYSDDATVLPPNAPAVTTKEGIRKTWKEILDLPGFTLTWKATKVEMAKSGDMAYVIGTYDLTFNDASGSPVKERGKYLEVFEKQPDGKWKCGADMFSSDLPAAATK